MCDRLNILYKYLICTLKRPFSTFSPFSTLLCIMYKHVHMYYVHTYFVLVIHVLQGLIPNLISKEYYGSSIRSELSYIQFFL